MDKILQFRPEEIRNNSVIFYFIKVFIILGELNTNTDIILLIMGFQQSLYKELIHGC